ncbi:MAG: CBS domain-containing protein [Candidatus Altiarchaeota archaeon]|nr:CBS domain-containing protein [Candidatus Altiarchaeota archaeon]
MAKMISTTQREILDALIRLYEKKRGAIKGEDIANDLERSPGTIRNQMQTLRALGYVDGVPGPKGGYTPALKAYEVLELQKIEKPSHVGIYRNKERVKDVDLQKIILINIAHPNECKAIITVLGDTRQIKEYEHITAGPTPINHVIVRGKVIGRDDSKSEIMLECSGISSIPKGRVKDVACKKLITVKADDDMSMCAKKLTEHRINAAPIIENGRLVGMVTLDEITRAVAKKMKNPKAKDIALRDVFTIDQNASILDSIQRMEELDVGRLIVMDDDKPIGIITRTDILLKMTH